MPTRLVHLAVDCADAPRIARFWAELLGWSITVEDAEESYLEDPAAPAVGLSFGPVPEPKTVQNRLHLDLASASREHQGELVARSLDLGARRIDIGQGDVPWVVLADPEGNEYCVLEPRPAFAATGPIAALALRTADPVGLAPFLSAAVGWPVFWWRNRELALLRPPAAGLPWLAMVSTDEPKIVKNRIHLDVAPYEGEEIAGEVARLTAMGARPADIGQGDGVPWTVLADPQGNEFCVLTARPDRQAAPSGHPPDQG
jgi:hypothetical protein